MRCLNEPIARAANREDGCTGRFWEGRFKSQALLDERAELQAMAYVDLNPIRAKIAAGLEDSDFTSIQSRMRAKGSPMQLLLLPFAEDKCHRDNSAQISYNLIEYIQLVDWTGKHIKAAGNGHISTEIPQILAHQCINTAAWLHNCKWLERTYYRVIGSVTKLQEYCRKLKQQRVLGITAARQAFG